MEDDKRIRLQEDRRLGQMAQEFRNHPAFDLIIEALKGDTFHLFTQLGLEATPEQLHKLHILYHTIDGFVAMVDELIQIGKNAHTELKAKDGHESLSSRNPPH